MGPLLIMTNPMPVCEWDAATCLHVYDCFAQAGSAKQSYTCRRVLYAIVSMYDKAFGRMVPSDL